MTMEEHHQQHANALGAFPKQLYQVMNLRSKWCCFRLERRSNATLEHVFQTTSSLQKTKDWNHHQLRTTKLYTKENYLVQICSRINIEYSIELLYHITVFHRTSICCPHAS